MQLANYHFQQRQQLPGQNAAAPTAYILDTPKQTKFISMQPRQDDAFTRSPAGVYRASSRREGVGP